MPPRSILALLGMISMLALAQCARNGSKEGGGPMPLTLTSPAFQEGGSIPPRHACDGEDVSPALAWTGVPDSTKSLALICDDPDAPMGTWVHWVLYAVPADTDSLPEGVSRQESVEGVGLQGRNDFKGIGYGGPCPPPGKPHRYYFKLYALDSVVPLKPGATKKELEAAMRGHVLAHGQLMGRYRR
jgi:Raf kinase inhibitor-like YbhB/YbcL family protein